MSTFAKNFKIILLILAGSLVWSLTMVKSGLAYDYGIGFWGPNGHDGIWHLSLIHSLAQGRLDMPIFSGENIKNYHLGFDILLAIFSKISFISPSLLYFQILPPILALTLGFLVYKFVVIWQKSALAAWWSVFFLYFGGSLGWLVNFIKDRTFGGESMFWAQQSISTLLNPPFALSLILIFTGLLILTNKPSSKNLLLASLLFGLLSFIKIYAAILILAGLCISCIYKKDIYLVKVFILTLVINLLLFLPFNKNSSSLIIFRPGWFLQSLLSVSDRFQWMRLYQALISRNIFKQLISYVLALLIFIIGNLSTRLLFLSFIKKHKLDIFSLILLASSVVGLLIPMLFVQAGTPWNPIQFFYYTQIFLGILAGISLSKISKFTYLIYGLVLILTLPTTFDTLRHYWPFRPPAMISKEEITALKYLSRLPYGVILVHPISPDAYYPAPRPLYYYDSTAYVSAYSGQPVFLEDEVNLNITGYNWPARKKLAEEFIHQTDPDKAKLFLTQYHIRYYYSPLVAKYRPALTAQQLGGKVIFENSQSTVWEVNVK
jgi:hypothetical protein